jgi:AcrR family transcriptional regulator
MMVAAETSRREGAKAERRRRIVEAAASLVRDQGFDAVSMVQIAERAAVSPGTLYNLFQTKGAIFRQVFDLDLQEYERLLAQAPAQDSLDRMFVAIELAASLYRSNPDFYRAMAHVGADDADGLGSAIAEPRTAFWQAQVADAVITGSLQPETNANVLGVALTQLMRGVFLEWAGRVISADRLAKEAAFGFAMALLAYAVDDEARSLRRRLRSLQIELAQSSRTEDRKAA